MPHVRSADGTTIAFETTGRGPGVILVDFVRARGGESAPVAAFPRTSK